MNPIIVIPTRMASTRLPGKPLAGIGGEPMIRRVVRRALAAELGPVVVAAAEAEIVEAVALPGVRVVLTDPALPSGSDRVHAAVEAVDAAGLHDVVVNLQGDLPLFPPDDLRRVLLPLERGEYDLATLVARVTEEREIAASSIVKAACAFTEGDDVARALYFSRIAVPWGEGPLWHHIGVYGWRRAALRRFVSLPPSPLELRESLEQLRALEAGMAVGCVAIARAPLGVDTPEDLERVRAVVALAEKDVP
ncbi:3-deoxy-manno-octulosonate cytidylyltransferase [Acidomonas methanolica]|uniref:3-deoxy-manno-octulosonate cytidylyltransferase n=1 Tax=Acidomonas methanolica TaxID=437 RepID=UPI00211A46BB|nr:3-deoxy-manno-octulosonate cytidylyltransferase [Acidomonas methanolica]MCQ9154513.1 3-deoxy-manno-octulosonate cytidylyltransferase [Acidomonas methanolica]